MKMAPLLQFLWFYFQMCHAIFDTFPNRPSFTMGQDSLATSSVAFLYVILDFFHWV